MTIDIKSLAVQLAGFAVLATVMTAPTACFGPPSLADIERAELRYETAAPEAKAHEADEIIYMISRRQWNEIPPALQNLYVHLVEERGVTP